MNRFLFSWLIIIAILTSVLYHTFKGLLKTKRQKVPLLCIFISTFIYSGIGICYEKVNKVYLIYYIIFLASIAITYTFLVTNNTRILLNTNRKYKFRCIDDVNFWSSKNTKIIFKYVVCLYVGLRILSLIYPVNRLSNFSLAFNSENNLANLNGTNASFIGVISTWIQPLYLIGLYYVCTKVKQVAFFLGLDQLVTLITTGYLSRYRIIVIIIICLFLFFNDDLNDKYISLSKKRKRIVFSLLILMPIVIYVMLTMMELRISGSATFTISDLITSEIGYPLQYDKIFCMAPISTASDFFLQLLDSFVPIIPTPIYHMDLNVDFSIRYLGYGLDVSWFSVMLPSVLGESVLIFGKYLFWIHGIVIGCLCALIYKVVRENKCVVILFYHYLTCILTTGRAGYEQLSQSILLNYVFLVGGIYIIRRISYRFKYRRRIQDE